VHPEQDERELTFFSVPLVPNSDGLRLTSAEPHSAQATLADMEKTSFSKSSPQDSQRYS
jgi:hypothetical protein